MLFSNERKENMIPKYYHSKRQLRIINVKGKRLKWEQRVVYSYLIFRYPYHCSLKRIATETQLDRTKGVRQAIDKLEKSKLVGKIVEGKNPRYRACEAPADLVSYKDSAEPWNKRIMSFEILFPRRGVCPLTKLECAIYWFLHSSNLRNPSIELISNFLNISPKTVKRALVKLRKEKLFEDGSLKPRAPTPEQLSWWEDKPEKVIYEEPEKEETKQADVKEQDTKEENTMKEPKMALWEIRFCNNVVKSLCPTFSSVFK